MPAAEAYLSTGIVAYSEHYEAISADSTACYGDTEVGWTMSIGQMELNSGHKCVQSTVMFHPDR